MKQKQCLTCNQWFFKKYPLKKWLETKYCSRDCYYKSRIGKYVGENHPSWRGDNIGFAAIHIWLRTNYGQPNKCEKCGKIGSNDINWALLKNKKYERKRENFWRLCDKCHIAYDEIRGKRIEKGQHISLKTEIQKGQHLSPKTEFKKGKNLFYLHKPNCQCFYHKKLNTIIT